MSSSRRTLLVPAAALAASALAACGASADTPSTETGALERTEPRVVEVSMVDSAFEPDELTVEEGEEVTFRFTNDGKVTHEAVIGDEAGQKVHADDLADDGVHSHPAILHGPAVLDVAPGETATITYIFGEAGTMLIGCHEPGHYERGMVAEIEVS